ncbi:MAG: hypothetical protein HN726_05805 [Candidatus Magasanikbacteria bacterium]|jgi:hypothetical protein|nr:hypothetical protein [Candidatus Magasanikbacteria bacterium]
MTYMNKSIKKYHDIQVNVIVTFENSPQEFFDICPTILNPKYCWTKNEYNLTVEETFNGYYNPEKSVISEICELLRDLNSNIEDVIKLSLCYRIPDYVDTNTYEDKVKSGYDFIMRTNSKYCFQPDQRDEFEDDLMKTFGLGRKVKSFIELYGEYPILNNSFIDCNSTLYSN